MPRIVPESVLHGDIVFSSEEMDKAEYEMAERALDICSDEDLLLVGLLTGGAYALQGLIRAMSAIRPTHNIEYEYMRTGNYGSGTEAAGPRIYADLPAHVSVKDRVVGLVDDIFDSGGSSELAGGHLLNELGAARVMNISLLYRSVKIDGAKGEEIVIPNSKPKPEICGREYADIPWVVGRGLNGPESGPGGGRSLPHVAICAFQPDTVVRLRPDLPRA